MYQKVSPDMNFVDREKNVGKFWRNQQIHESKRGQACLHIL